MLNGTTSPLAKGCLKFVGQKAASCLDLAMQDDIARLEKSVERLEKSAEEAKQPAVTVNQHVMTVNQPTLTVNYSVVVKQEQPVPDVVFLIAGVALIGTAIYLATRQ